MAPILVAAISDTHVPDKARALPAALVEQLREVDLILHAGDFTGAATLSFISTLAPSQAVHGNVDDAYLKATLPGKLVVDVGRFRIGLIHGDGPGPSTLERARKAFTGVDCIVFGHSHSPCLSEHDGTLLLNPGSPTDKRGQPRPSFALLRITDAIEAELIYLWSILHP